MTVQIHSSGFRLEAPLRESIRRRLDFAFRRIRPSVDHIHVRLLDHNGPRGGALDKEVLLEVGLRGAPPVIVAQRDESWRGALSQASERAWRAALRQIDRRKGRPMRPSRGPTALASSALPRTDAAAEHDAEELLDA